MSTTMQKAEFELDLIVKSAKESGDSSIVEPFIPEILELVYKFTQTGQSGMSAPYTARVISQTIEKLCLHKPLSPITGDESELLGWILSEGYVKWSPISNSKSTAGGVKRGVRCMIAQSKDYFLQNIIDLLNRLDIRFKLHVNNSGVEVISLNPSDFRSYIRKLGIPEEGKHDIDWSTFILQMSYNCLERFFNAFFLGDGSLNRENNSYTITQNEGRIFDALELCGNLLGYRTTKNLKHLSDKCYEIRFSPINVTTGQRLIKLEGRKVDVFCLTTDNGTFIIKQNSIITITGNCTYMAGPQKISESANIPLDQARTVVEAYWKRNWAVKEYAETRDVKEADKRDWIYNPYSKLWLELKSQHIKFSACNQNFGAKVFDMWMFFCLKYGLKPIFQAHDELLLCVDDNPEEIENVKVKLLKAIEMVNKYYNHPIKFEIDIQVGKTYEEVH
jgi:hypothetical protein